MATNLFALHVLQAINDWQRGYNQKQKPKRIAALKAAVAELDPSYRVVFAPCYRQITLEPRFVMEMGSKYRIQETVSSWSLRVDVAESIKGGVAPEGMDLLPVILRTLPDPECVVVNFAALYADEGFLAAVESQKGRIDRFWDGIGRWGDSQAEVVLELDAVYLHEVYATGGHSSPREGFAQLPHVQEQLSRLGAKPDMQATIERMIAAGQGDFGPRWLTGAPKDRILRKWIEHAERITGKWRQTQNV